MIRLNQTASQLISLITAQNGATCVVSYSDKSATGYDGDTQVTAITSATTTTICSTPAASTIRDIDHISVKNTYAGSHIVTVQISSSAVLYPLITVTLDNGDSLEYTHGSGFQVLDSNGQQKFSMPGYLLLTGGTLSGALSGTSAAFSGAVTALTYNGHTFTTGSSTFTGTAGQTYTFPTTTATIARTDASQTFSGTQTFDVLATTGNVTLGDASTDTVRVNGYVGVGAAGSSNVGIYIQNSALTGTAQYGIVSNVVGTPAGTTAVIGFQTQPGTAASAYTVSDVIGMRAFDATKGAGSTITNQHAIYIYDQTKGTNNYGVTIAVSAGANKRNIYASGTAINHMNGGLLIGSNTDDGVHKLQVTGSINSTTTISTGGYTVATLPAGATGDRAYVTDATAPTWLAALTGGGAVVCPVFYNGVAWVSA